MTLMQHGVIYFFRKELLANWLTNWMFTLKATCCFLIFFKLYTQLASSNIQLVLTVQSFAALKYDVIMLL